MKHYLLLLCMLFFFSCENVLLEGDKASTDPYDNFEYLWNECNEKYTYFDLKGINWDDVKTTYRAQLYEDMTQDSLFRVLGSMLKELKDDHTNLISNFNISFFGVRYLGQDNFDWRIIEDNYLDRDYYISSPFRHSFIADNQLGYVRLSSFPGTVSARNIDFVLKRYKDTKGLILDLRENGGGRVSDVFALLSRFVDKKTLVQYSRKKSGVGSDQFTEPLPAYVEPYRGIRYTEPVAVLVDRGTYSSGSLFSLGTKAIPHMSLVGDTTGGGLGLPNGGQLPNGWTYRFSITQTLNLDKQPDYENGVPVDVPVLIDWNNHQRDEILDKAIEELLK